MPAPILPIVALVAVAAAAALAGRKKKEPPAFIAPAPPSSETPESQLARMRREKPETAQYIDRLLKDTNATSDQLMTAAITLKANGWHEVAKLLIARAGALKPLAKGTASQELAAMPRETRAYVMRLLGDTQPPPTRTEIMSAVAQLKDKYPELAKQLVAKEIALSSADPSRKAPASPPQLTPGGEPTLTDAQRNRIAALLSAKDSVGLRAMAVELRRSGQLLAASDLDREAAAFDAAKRPAAVEPSAPTLTADRKTQIINAIYQATTPEQLERLAASLRGSPELDALARQALQRAGELKKALEEAKALQETQKILTPAEPDPPPPTVVPDPEPPPQVREPYIPPPPAPPPKTPLQIQTEALASYIKGARKYKEDKGLVEKWQGAAGGSAGPPDGKFGAGSATRMAQLGVSDLPMVWYWPRTGATARVARYKGDLRALATVADGLGEHSRAEQLRISANRDNGQGRQYAEPEYKDTLGPGTDPIKASDWEQSFAPPPPVSDAATAVV